MTGAFSFLLFCVLTFVIVCRPSDYIPALAPFRLALVMTPLTVLATLLQRAPGGRSPFRHPETKLYLAYFFTMCVGVPFAMHRGQSFDHVLFAYSTNIAYFLLFLTQVTTRDRFRRVVFTLVTGATLFSVISLVRSDFGGGRFFGATSMYDPNDVAYVELGFLPFALCLLMGSVSHITRFTRFLALASALAGMLVAVYTGSRGGLLGILTFMLLFLTLRIGRLKPVHKGALLAAIVGAVALNADKINFDRYETIASVEKDYNLDDSANGGRMDVWRKGWVIFTEYPLTGVGANNFSMAIGNLRKDLGVLPFWQTAHSSWVQILVEIGIFGMVLWAMLVTSTVRTLSRLRTLDGSSGTSELGIWAGVLLVGFVGQLVAASFLSMGYSIFFTLFFAVSASLREIVFTSERSETPPPVEGGHRPRQQPAKGIAWRRPGHSAV